VSAKVTIAPEVLEWARQRAGLDLADLVKEFPKLKEWEQGEGDPTFTFKQLEKLAQKTHVPLGMLFLSTPPEEQLPINDFRTLPGASLNRPSPNLLETIYTCQRRQDWYRNYLQSQEAEGAKAYVGSVTLKDDITQVAAQIREEIGLSLEERAKMKDWEETWRTFIDKVERLGILVMVNGVVGNNTRRKLDPEEFRGFALVDPIAPLIFINGADTKAAQMFTLAHELAHVWLGEEGVSNVQISDFPAQKTIESWCNKVAAEILVPLSLFRGEYQNNEELMTEVKRLAKTYKVSSLVSLRRVYDLGIIDSKTLSENYIKELGILKKKNLNQDPTKKGGGNYYSNLNRKLGKQFLKAVVTNTLEGGTTFQEAFRVLDVSAPTFDRVAQSLRPD